MSAMTTEWALGATVEELNGRTTLTSCSPASSTSASKLSALFSKSDNLYQELRRFAGELSLSSSNDS